MPRVIFLYLLLVSGGCASSGVDNSDSGSRYSKFKDASMDALKDPNVWIPVAGAVVVAVSGLDNPISKDAYQDSKLFHDPQGSSDDLKDLAALAFVASSIAVPRANFKQRAHHFGIDVAAVSTSIGISNVLKQITSRQRPAEDNEKSFPSGHATLLGAYSNATRRNLNAIDMPGWAATSLNLTMHGIAIAGSWARVEAGKHHVSDVLVGYALGNYMTSVFHKTFIATDSPLHLSFQTLPEGGALTLTRRLSN